MANLLFHERGLAEGKIENSLFSFLKQWQKWDLNYYNMATSWLLLHDCKEDLLYPVLFFWNWYLQRQDVFRYFNSLGAHELLKSRFAYLR